MIGNNINELMAMAESQSDERLAQELNPQTETGMLGPTWLPASELSFREKMRSGAQAQQQQNNLPIIDQLAQSAMPPQGMPQQMMPQGMPPQGMPPQGMMPQQPMPQQMMPQQPMPQGMPPQQPMPQGMPPQMMAEGGIIGGDMSGIGLMKNMMEEGGMQGLLQMLSNKQEDEDLDQVTQRAMAAGGMVAGDSLLNVWDKMSQKKKMQTMSKYSERDLDEMKKTNNDLYAKIKEEGFDRLVDKSSESDRERKFWDAYKIDPYAFAKDAEYYDILQNKSAGGLLNYANGGQIDVGQRVGPLLSPDDLYKRIFQDYYDPTQANPDQLTFPRDTTYDTDPFGLDKYPDVSVPSDRETMDALIGNPLDVNRVDQINRKYADKRQEKPSYPIFAPSLASPWAKSGLPEDTNEQRLALATDAPYAEDSSPFGRLITRATRGLAGHGTTKEIENEIVTEDILADQGKNLDTILIEGGVKGFFKEGLSDEDYQRVKKAEDFYEDLIGTAGRESAKSGPGGISPMQTMFESDSKTMSRYFAQHPDQYTELLKLQEKHGDQEGLLLFAEQNMKSDEKKPTETQVLEEIQVTAQKRGPLVDQDGGPPKGQIINETSEGTNVITKPSDIVSDTTGRALQDDVMQAEQQRLNEQKDHIFKGNMDRKWMAIAAGAFNAAQKGAPTLMQGLADLGGGITEELQKMDKEDQDRAIALHQIYIEEATLAESKRKTDLTYSSDMASVMSKMTQAGIDNKMEQLKYLLESGTDYADIAKSVSQGMINPDYLHSADVLHSKIGNPNAQISYNQHLSKLINKEAEITSKIEEEIGEDYDPKNSEHKERAMALYDEFLNDNPGLREIRSDYWSGANQSDWVTGTLIL